MEDAERTIRRLRIDARAEQEDAEAAAAELARAARTLRDAVLDHAREGAALRVEIGTTVIAGRPVHVGEDLLRLVVADQSVVDIAIGCIGGVFVSGAPNGPVAVSTGYPATLLARSRELVQANAEVEIGRRSLPCVIGSLMAATTTHVEVHLRDGGVWLVPWNEITWVARTTS